jgi:hypothetical protein
MNSAPNLGQLLKQKILENEAKEKENLPIESDEFIPDRFIRGETDPLPYIIIWIVFIVGSVIWAAS